MVNRIPDNLKPEGNFVQKEPEKWYPGDRADRVIRKDNLRMEGDRQLIPFSRHEYNATCCDDGMHLKRQKFYCYNFCVRMMVPVDDGYHSCGGGILLLLRLLLWFEF